MVTFITRSCEITKESKTGKFKNGKEVTVNANMIFKQILFPASHVPNAMKIILDKQYYKLIQLVVVNKQQTKNSPLRNIFIQTLL